MGWEDVAAHDWRSIATRVAAQLEGRRVHALAAVVVREGTHL
jgi:hypothetical protein